MGYSKSELKKLSTNGGLKFLLTQDIPDFEDALKQVKYLDALKNLQIELIQLQRWVITKEKRLVVIFEGGEFSGKGSTIQAFREKINPRSSRVVALPKPTRIDLQQWYFKRYVMQLPKPGEMVFFDRSWYNRAVVEPVNGFCTKKQYKQFMRDVNAFENMLNNDGVIIKKIFLSISKTTQAKRLKDIQNNPLRRWELSPIDLNAQKNWNNYIEYQERMFENSKNGKLPWSIIDSNDIRQAHLDAIKNVLDYVPGRIS